jgi:hypothetical protein
MNNIPELRLPVNNEVASACFPAHMLTHTVLAMTLGYGNISGIT